MVKTIAVDFDGTLFEKQNYPSFGKPRWDVINKLKKEIREHSAQTILWTCREGKDLNTAIYACKAVGLTFAAINDNTPENKYQYGNNSRKVYADEYWDDKAICP